MSVENKLKETDKRKGSFALPLGLFFLGMVCLMVAKFIWDVM
ncbi:hypothetical protein ACTFR8_23550 [Bacillus cereus group sp. MYBK15-3]|nr:hypothetical protein [Bacillus cereus]